MKSYIDERPFEEIVQSVILDEKHKDYIANVVNVAQAFDTPGYKHNPYMGDSTIYDTDIAMLTRRKNQLLKDRGSLEKIYTASFEKVVALETGNQEEKNRNGNRNEEEDENEEEVLYETKGKQATIRIKPAEVAKRKKEQTISATNFRATMATTQQEILELNKELYQISANLDRLLFHQEIAVKCFISLRRILVHYQEKKDIEYVKKGAYFVRDYSLGLLNRYKQ